MNQPQNNAQLPLHQQEPQHQQEAAKLGEDGIDYPRLTSFLDHMNVEYGDSFFDNQPQEFYKHRIRRNPDQDGENDLQMLTRTIHGGGQVSRELGNTSKAVVENAVKCEEGIQVSKAAFVSDSKTGGGLGSLPATKANGVGRDSKPGCSRSCLGNDDKPEDTIHEEGRDLEALNTLNSGQVINKPGKNDQVSRAKGKTSELVLEDAVNGDEKHQVSKAATKTLSEDGKPEEQLASPQATKPDNVGQAGSSIRSLEIEDEPEDTMREQDQESKALSTIKLASGKDADKPEKDNKVSEAPGETCKPVSEDAIKHSEEEKQVSKEATDSLSEDGEPGEGLASQQVNKPKGVGQAGSSIPLLDTDGKPEGNHDSKTIVDKASPLNALPNKFQLRIEDKSSIEEAAAATEEFKFDSIEWPSLPKPTKPRVLTPLPKPLEIPKDGQNDLRQSTHGGRRVSRALNATNLDSGEDANKPVTDNQVSLALGNNSKAIVENAAKHGEEGIQVSKAATVSDGKTEGGLASLPETKDKGVGQHSKLGCSRTSVGKDDKPDNTMREGGNNLKAVNTTELTSGEDADKTEKGMQVSGGLGNASKPVLEDAVKHGEADNRASKAATKLVSNRCKPEEGSTSLPATKSNGVSQHSKAGNSRPLLVTDDKPEDTKHEGCKDSKALNTTKLASEEDANKCVKDNQVSRALGKTSKPVLEDAAKHGEEENPYSEAATILILKDAKPEEGLASLSATNSDGIDQHSEEGLVSPPATTPDGNGQHSKEGSASVPATKPNGIGQHTKAECGHPEMVIDDKPEDAMLEEGRDIKAVNTTKLDSGEVINEPGKHNQVARALGKTSELALDDAVNGEEENQVAKAATKSLSEDGKPEEGLALPQATKPNGFGQAGSSIPSLEINDEPEDTMHKQGQESKVLSTIKFASGEDANNLEKDSQVSRALGNTSKPVIEDFVKHVEEENQASKEATGSLSEDAKPEEGNKPAGVGQAGSSKPLLGTDNKPEKNPDSNSDKAKALLKNCVLNLFQLNVKEESSTEAAAATEEFEFDSIEWPSLPEPSEPRVLPPLPKPVEIPKVPVPPPEERGQGRGRQRGREGGRCRGYG